MLISFQVLLENSYWTYEAIMVILWRMTKSPVYSAILIYWFIYLFINKYVLRANPGIRYEKHTQTTGNKLFQHAGI